MAGGTRRRSTATGCWPTRRARLRKYRDALGVLRRESSETEKEQEARRELRKKEGANVLGKVGARPGEPRS